MSQPKSKPVVEKEYVVRVPKKSRKNYHMMRFHTANGIEFKSWSGVKMERENNFKEYKNAEEDMPRFGAGSEFGREQRDEARRKKHGIRIKKYKPEDQPWLLSVKDKNNPPSSEKASTSASVDKKFKGIREGGVSDNVSWYVFLQAKDGAFEAFPVEEWYNFQPINRYKALTAEEAENEFEKRDKIMNYFSVMYQKKLRNEEEEAAEAGDEKKKKAAVDKSLMLSEMDDWMSDKDSDDSGSDNEEKEKKPTKPKGKKGGFAKKKSGHRGVKKRKKEDGEDGTDCEEESDEFNDGAEHEYISEDSSDSDQENYEKVTKDLEGVDQAKGLKKLLNSDDEDEEDENKEDDEKKEEENEKEEKKVSSPDISDSSDDEKPAAGKAAKGSSERASESIKRKIVAAEGSLPLPKKPRSDSPTVKVNLDQSESAMFEEAIRRYLLRKPMNTTEILQKLKSKKTGHTSEQLVQIIADMLKRINPTKKRVQGKMYLSLKA